MGPLLLNGPGNGHRTVAYYYWDYRQWSVLYQYCDVVDRHSYPGIYLMLVASYIDTEILCLMRLTGMCILDKHIYRGSDDPLARFPRG